MPTAIYARISEDRSGQEAGVTRQLEDCRALASQRGLELIGEYSDNDLSALNGRPRPGYVKLLEAVRAGHVDTIVCWHTSRLWRNRRERAEAFDLLRQRKVAVIAVKGPSLDMASASGRMIAGILGEFDQAESEIKAERVARAARQRAERGGNHGGRRSFGFTKNGRELVPVEADAIRYACKEVLAGVPLRAVARTLTQRKIPTVTGRPRWDPSVIRQMIIGPRIAGLSEYKGEIVGRGVWPAIVDEPTWRAVRATVLAPGRLTSTGNTPVGLLSGWGLCAACGGVLISSIKREQTSRRAIYRCRRGCVGRSRERVDHFIGQVVIATLSEPDAADLLVDIQGPDFEALQAESVELRARLDTAAGQYADGVITSSQLEVISSKLRTRLAEIDGQQAHVDRAPVLRDLVEADDVTLAWDGLSFERRRAVVQVLMDVLILPGNTGRRDFDPNLVKVVWRNA